MEKTIDALMLSVVNKSLNQVLETYPDYPYQKALNNPEFRRHLITRVLSQLSNWHPSEEQKEKAASSSDHLQLSPEDKIHIQNLIRQEIAYIIQQKSDCVSRTATEEVDTCATPSHWFG
jgi:hypothetical protein